MKETLFVTGGCRSGKSKFAMAFADRSFKQKIFMATCLAQDQEMEQRITEHQKSRGPEWQTMEVPIALPEAVASQGSKADVILVDCLTLWVSNLLAEGASQKKILAHSDALTKAIHKVPCSMILV